MISKRMIASFVSAALIFSTLSVAAVPGADQEEILPDPAQMLESIGLEELNLPSADETAEEETVETAEGEETTEAETETDTEETVIETDDSDIAEETQTGATASGRVAVTQPLEKNGLQTVGTNGYTHETIDKYESFSYVDPEYISDEQFFGVWNAETEEWEVEPFMDYTAGGALTEAGEAVKEGNHQLAAEKILEFYQDKFSDRTAQVGTLTVEDLTRTWADVQEYNLLFSSAVGYQARDIATVPATSGWVRFDISDDVQDTAASAGNMERSYTLVALEKDGYSASFSSKEGTNAPYVQVAVNGVLRTFPVIKDSMVSAGSNASTNYGSDAVLYATESQSSIHEGDLSAAPIDSGTQRAYFNVDFTGLGEGDTIGDAYLYVYGQTDNPDGKLVTAISSGQTSWTETTLTWNNPAENSANIFSYDGESGPHWDYGSYMSYRFQEDQQRFQSDAAAFRHAYMATGEEHYVYHLLRLMINYYQKRGYDPGYYVNLDTACRMQGFAGNLPWVMGSEFMTPDVLVTLLKYIWQMQEDLIAGWNNQSLTTNWGSYEATGISMGAIYFHEFTNAGKPLEDGATPQNGGRGGWLEVAGYRYAIVCNEALLEDGSAIENSLEYTIETISNSMAQITQAQNAGWYDFELPDSLKETLTALTHYIINASGPHFGDFQQGDCAHYSDNLMDRIAEIADYVDDPLIDWAVSGKTEGSAPDYTSIIYPAQNRVIMRSGWSDDDIYMYINADGATGSHGHSDDLTLNMFAYGNYLLADPRYISYDMENPYRVWQVSTRGHNTVEVNGLSQKGGGWSMQFNIERFDPLGNSVYLSDGNSLGSILDTELNDIYDYAKLNTPNNLNVRVTSQAGETITSSVDHDRSVLFLKSGYVIVTDHLRPEDKSRVNSYALGWHFLPEANPTLDETTGVVSTNFNNLANIKVSPVIQSDAQTTSLKPGWYSYETGSVTDMLYSSTDKSVAGDTSFNTLLVPEKANDSLDVTTENIDLDISDGEGAAFRLNITNEKANQEIEGSYYTLLDEELQEERKFGDFTTDGTLAYSERENGQYSQSILRNGTILNDDTRGIALVRSTEPVGDVGITYDRSNIAVESSEEDFDIRSLQIYANNKAISSVTVNGENVSFHQDGNTGDVYFASDMPFEGNPSDPGDDDDAPGGGSGTGGNRPTGGTSHGTQSGGGSGTTTTPVDPQPSQEPDTLPADQFADELNGHWAEEEITAMVNDGIVNGVSEDSLGLQDTTTRAEFVTLLLRAFDTELQPYSGEFEDVSADDWYADYIATAAAIGILEGDGSGANPNGWITREEMAKILVDMYEYQFGEISVSGTETAVFEDMGLAGSWAVPYIQKAVAAGLMNGVSETSFEPGGNALREQAIVVVYRLLQDTPQQDTEQLF